jgi:hypothetical protein
VYERETGEKLDPRCNRQMHKVRQRRRRLKALLILSATDRFLGPWKIGKEIWPERPEAREDAHVCGRPPPGSRDSPSNDREEVRSGPTSYRTVLVPPARWVYGKPAKRHLGSPIQAYYSDGSTRPDRRSSPAAARVHVRVHERVSRYEGGVRSLLLFLLYPK